MVLKEETEFAINGKQKYSVREKIVAVFGTTKISVQQKSERVSEAERSPSGKFARQPCRHYIKGECTRPSCDNGHPTECQFYKTESGCKFCEKCSFVHRQVADQRSKKPKGDGDNNAVALLKDSRQLGCVSQDTEPLASLSILRKTTKVLEPIRRVQFSKAMPSLGVIQV